MKEKNNMSKIIYKNVFWAILTMISLTLVFSVLFEATGKIETLSINQLVAKINSGEVAKITVEGNNLKIDLKDGKKAVAKKETETGLSQTLNNYGVRPEILDQLNLEVKEPSGF
ncbi:MAG: ATP-dependent metallopeptidase FtsH/Yme1/Tma family protein, partial [Patescibacteria group bacterium]